ncbi:MAG: glutathione peroxidase [Bacilli bacterium]|nr:glutathione peroxidase [Bacilli bacterium]
MNFYELKAKKRNGEELSFQELKGKVVIIVNTATGCGFTPQYKGLEELYEKYHEKGLEILDFPCNQFGHQAPGSNDEIHAFCEAKYQTQFETFAKIEVNGEQEDEVFTYIKKCQKEDIIHGMKNKITMKGIQKISSTCKHEGDILWNFTKFIIDKEGNVVARYSPIEDPKTMEEKIIELLEK